MTRRSTETWKGPQLAVAMTRTQGGRFFWLSEESYSTTCFNNFIVLQ